MQRLRYLLRLAFLVALAAHPAQAACTVADPTGTPLNVRDAPNGSIVGALPNGLEVEQLEEHRLGAKTWIRVSVDGAPRGWVFGAYVICSGDDGDIDSQKSAPMRPRASPN
ncbi:SH3 domain-containing protein [Pararhizobium antarcticum]|nr:SH3 domain-containing protein [Pararhizobium antarcticum]